MYIPQAFEETRIDVMHELIRAHPLATLVTLTGGGLEANHIPMVIAGGATSLGVLRGHIARANPLSNDSDSEVEALVIFHGPQIYISPSWYPTKEETGGRAAPTWNYAVVHAHGRLRFIDDAEWLRANLESLTAQNEAPFPEPWAVEDAPEDYLERMIANIVGVEIIISKLQGKWKVSQNQPARNQTGVVAGLRQCGSDGARTMAELVEARSRKL